MMTLSILLKATLVLAAALGGTWLTRHSRAAVRHLLLAAAFGMLLVVPAASFIFPSIRIAVPDAVESAIAPLTTETSVDVAESDPIAGTPPTATTNAFSSWRWPSRAEILFGVWMLGAAIFLLPVIVGLGQIRALRRTALPWREGQRLVDGLAAPASVHRHVELLLHEALPGPMTCGVIRPAIILPADATSWTQEDLHRAIIHELEHVRRFDWLTQCLARAIAAVYWFHPIVWMTWRKFALEAERACDDAVLCSAQETDETAYADQLVHLAQKLSSAPAQIHLAMADRRDLTARIGAVLDSGQRRGRAGRLAVLLASGAAAVFVVTMSPLRLEAGMATLQSGGTTASQAPRASGERHRYDAASIKPCEAEENPTGARGTFGGTNATFSPGRFYVPCVTTEQLIYLAYATAGARQDERLVNDDPGTASNATKVRGGPDWVHSLRDKYRIEATAPGVTERTILMGVMLRTLLEERFRLKLHRETEEVPMFKLVVAKGGFKLKPMKDGDCEPNDGTPVDMRAAKPRCGNLMMLNNSGLTSWTFGGFNIDGLANSLSRNVGAHVIDETGLKDRYIIRFEFVRDRDAAAGTTGPDVFTALQEQLGLKLEQTRGPRGYLVIDSIERPTPDEPTPIPARAQGPGRR